MIPLARDTRESIGAYAERVENRSLLFQKMVLPKTALLRGDRFDDAQRFNVLRATHEGGRVLQEEAESARNYASRGGQNADASRYKAEVAAALATIRTDHPELAESRIRSHNRFLLDLEKSYRGRAVTFVASLGGRLLIDMAGGVMENSSLALDRITGLPRIPGTAVKGVTRHAALWEIRREPDPARQQVLLRDALAIFGFSPNDLGIRGDFLWAVHGNQTQLDAALHPFRSDTHQGVCSFISAHPTSTENLRIVAEVLTPHFNDNLRPIFFPAVEADSEFGFAIIGQRIPQQTGLVLSDLLVRAGDWLRNAITANGIGAKTGAGYGWFQIDPRAAEKRRIQLAEEATRIARERKAAAEAAAAELAAREAELAEADRLASLSPQDLARESIRNLADQDFAAFAKDLPAKTEAEQRAFLAVLLSKDRKETRQRWAKKKPDIWKPIAAVAAERNIPLP